MQNTTEKKVRSKCVAYAKSLGVLHMRNHKGSGAAVGWPDDVFFFGKKQSVWVEFKAPGGTLSPMQESVMRELLDRHQCFLCIDDFDKFKTVVDEFVAAYGAR